MQNEKHFPKNHLKKENFESKDTTRSHLNHAAGEYEPLPNSENFSLAHLRVLSDSEIISSLHPVHGFIKIKSYFDSRNGTHNFSNPPYDHDRE